MMTLYVLLGGLLFIAYSIRQGRRQYVAVDAWCSAGEEYDAWRRRHPDVHPGMSAAARTLIHERIRTYDEFIRLHPYCHDGPEYRRYLLDKLDDVPKKERTRRDRKS